MSEKEENNSYCLKSFLTNMVMWQDSLLQNYRLIFISSQSILLPLSVLIFVNFWSEYVSQNSSLPFPPLPALFIMFPLLAVGLCILYYWIKITHNRGLDVSYIQMQLLKYEGYRGKYLSNREQTSPFIAFKKDWQDEKSSREKEEILTKFEEKFLLDYTRKRMEKYLPSCFYTLWMIIFVLLIYYFVIDVAPIVIGIIGGFTICFYRLLFDC